MKRVRRRRKARRPSRHISISATDADWDVVRSNADRRGLSIARYLLELVERDASEEDAGRRQEYPALVLTKEEQREQLEAVREVRALMLEGEDAGLRHECPRHECPLVRDMQERIAVMFAAWASAMAGSGRSEELRLALASVLGEERAGIAAALDRGLDRGAGSEASGRATGPRGVDGPRPRPALVRRSPSAPPA